MALDLQNVAKLLEATLDPRQNRQAELALEQEAVKDGFSLLLLQIVANQSHPYVTRLAGALCFKNLIKRKWKDEEGNYKLPLQEAAAVKQELIGLMVSVPPGIQSQLGEAASLIAESDFWEQWDTLVDDLIARLTYDNFTVNNGVLQVAHSIFKRWRPLYRSDALFTEILHVLNKFGEPFLSLWETTDRLIEQNNDNKEKLQGLLSTMSLLIRLFYDLSCQDLPPVFETNLGAVSSLLHKYLIYDNPLLHTESESEPGPMEFVKAGICEALVLYIQKYEDAFGPHLDRFITSSWTLLTTVGHDTKYDILVSKALQFLTAVASIPVHAEKFNNEEILGQVVEKVVLPNLSLRDSDMELFEDEPIEFIRRDLEGSDNDTRRRAATDFVRQLMAQFEKVVTTVVSKYVDHYMADFAKNPKSNWKSKDTAVYLFSSIAATGVVTASHGVKSVNPLINVVEFFQNNIAGDLIAESGVAPLLKVDAIKFLYIFRSQMTKQQWRDAFPMLIKHLGSDQYVVYTYAAIAIERVLFMINDAREQLISKEDLLPIAGDLLGRLFQLIEKDAAPEKVQENEFLIRCVMRVLMVIRDGVLPIIDNVLNHLIQITKIISANPSNPRFYYYHFEALGALIRFAGPTVYNTMEKALYSPFAMILEKDIQEFIPYMFQLFAALLQCNPTGSLPTYYTSIIPEILKPALWESKGNVPALVRFLSIFIPRGIREMTSEIHIVATLGIFQKLLSQRANEVYAFDLLETIVGSFPRSDLEPYFEPMFKLILMRLHSSKTDSTLALRFVRFYHFMSARDRQGLGADLVVNVTEQIQEGVFVSLYMSIILPETQKLIRPLDRKTAVVSLCRTLTDSSAFSEKYRKGWGYTCEALLKLLEIPPVPSTATDDVHEHDVDDPSFGVGFTQLNSCRSTPVDAWPEMTDSKRWVGLALKEADAKHHGRISSYIQERLSDEARNVLVSYMQP